MGVVKLELAHSKNYCLVIPTGPRKGVAQTFKEGKEYMVDEATAEILLAKTDTNNNDIFRLVLDEPEVDEGGAPVSLVEKKTKEAKLKKAATTRRKKAKKKVKGKRVDPKTMTVEEVGPSKARPEGEGGIPVGLDDLGDNDDESQPGIQV